MGRGGAGKIGWRDAGPGGCQEIMGDCSRPPLLPGDSDSRPSVLLCSWCLQGCRCVSDTRLEGLRALPLFLLRRLS